MKLFYKVTLTTFLCLISWYKVTAQEQITSGGAEQAETRRLTDLLHKLEGTYQLQIINSREKAEFPMILLDTIVAKRHQTEVVYYQVKPHVRIKILPQNIIASQGFVPLDRIRYITAADKL